ncbi:MAG TPA: endonuclease III, partial [Acidimicrobiaceae bacterium]|nr:endonuclease III [Acidimicrobiaceae bacterium]
MSLVARPRTPAGRARRVHELLKDEYDAVCELDHRSPFELLVATILSAQCTDKRVNLTTPALFRRFPDAAALAGAEPDELEEIVHPTGFYRSKARNLQTMARRLVEEHDGEVPTSLADLVKLAGVGRKTANVIRSVAFG